MTNNTKLTSYVPPELAEAIKAQAAKEHRTVSNLMIHLIASYLEQLKTEEIS